MTTDVGARPQVDSATLPQPIPRRQRGSALVMVLIIGAGILTLTLLSVQTTKLSSMTQRDQVDRIEARSIAESALAHALVMLRRSGIEAPASGGGTDAVWVTFSGGEYLYETLWDAANDATTIRAWGRIGSRRALSAPTVAPTDTGWDPTGWTVEGVEALVKHDVFVPKSAYYVGNGGIQRPLGGFDWEAPGVDPTDPSTWTPSTTASSSQASWVPMVVDARDYPIDYIDNGGSPAPVTYPHEYPIWSSQNAIGQFNTEAWFKNSAGSGDPLINVFPPVGTSYSTDPTSPDYAFPIRPDLPDVQTYASSLWNSERGKTTTNELSGGTHSGSFGTVAAPEVTFVTGELNVASGTTFRGSGILVIRDDYDPNVDTDNTPDTHAWLSINGTFEWTGLVLVVGWNAGLNVNSGGDATIVGALLGEDSVQSMGEVSLDSATMSFNIQDDCRILWSSQLFSPGSHLRPLLPTVKRTLVGYPPHLG
ncbi:MAG: pilus assembly PilX N-terminal domain-containing protein [Planctomycetota bacterium]